MIHTLKNNYLAITIDEQGAELRSILRVNDKKELLWQASPQYWNGQSPILFPIVGSVCNNVIRHHGQTYMMPKHGLVRNMVFQYMHHDDTSITFRVESNEETLKHFPFPFRLEVTYRLTNNKLEVGFAIYNPSDQPLPFHLGAHPALNLPEYDENDEIHGYLGFGHLTDHLVGNGLKTGGLLWPEGSFNVRLDNSNRLPLTNHTFDCDTILDSRGLAHECTLYDKLMHEIATINFDSPIIALWSPRGGAAPFVCIEPWWGCCDKFDYKGEFAQRPWTNIAAEHSKKEIKYTITIH